MGIATFVAAGVADSVPDDLANPALPPSSLLKSLPCKDCRREEMFKPGLGIVMAAVHVPRFRVGSYLKHHRQLRLFNTAHTRRCHGKTRFMIVSERSRFRRIYSFGLILCCFKVMFRNMQGEEFLQQNARLPKQVWLPCSRGVPRTESSFSRM